MGQTMNEPLETTSEDTTARAHAAAVSAATETMLNCYMREGGEWRPVPASDVPQLAHPGDAYLAALPFEDLRAMLLVGITHLSPTHRHRIRMPVEIAMAGGNPVAVSLDTVAGMLVDQLSDPGLGDDPVGADLRGPDPTPVLHRMRASIRAVSAFLAARDGEIDALFSAEPLSFIESEQALLLGHMLHPTPKSRTEMTDEQLLAYAPETGARFQLHWLAVDPAIVEHDSATGTPAPELSERLLREDPAVDGAALDAALADLGERVLIPAHPWEIAYLAKEDAVVAALIEDGRIVELGPLGSPVTPTTSVRTVYNADWPFQLKLSLHVRVTNSLRVLLPKELRRGVEAARLLQTEIGERAAQVAPGFVMLQDPAYLTVRHGGQVIDGLSVVLRDNRWTTGAHPDVSALTTLCQDHPYGGRSRLAQIVAAIAAREGREESAVAREWFGRYCDVVIVPLVRLYLELGLCMEPHQQNVLVELEEGWPVRGVYRDSQGYFHRAAAHEDLVAILPGIGEASESVFPEALADERLVYYPFLNNALGVINALGVAGLIDEIELLRDLRDLLEAERERGGTYPATLLDRLLDDADWPCKGNLTTRLHDMDELVGDISEQSAYVRILNPLRGVPT
jgi:siderophore synthetase component